MKIARFPHPALTPRPPMPARRASQVPASKLVRLCLPALGSVDIGVRQLTEGQLQIANGLLQHRQSYRLADAGPIFVTEWHSRLEPFLRSALEGEDHLAYNRLERQVLSTMRDINPALISGETPSSLMLLNRKLGGLLGEHFDGRKVASVRHLIVEAKEIALQNVLGPSAGAALEPFIAQLSLRSPAFYGTPRGPLASALWVGPEGVGKCTAARNFSDALFGPKQFFYLDGRMFSEKPAVNSLLKGASGAPRLLHWVKEHPYGLIYCDHAHLFDDDFFSDVPLTGNADPGNDRADRNHLFGGKIVVFGTNLGMEDYLASLDLHERADPMQVTEEVFASIDRYLPERLIAALDEHLIHVWLPMRTVDRRQVALAYWNQSARPFFANLGRKIHLSSKAADMLTRPVKGAPPQFGNADIRGRTERLVFNPVMEQILAGQIASGPAERSIELDDQGGIHLK